MMAMEHEATVKFGVCAVALAGLTRLTKSEVANILQVAADDLRDGRLSRSVVFHDKKPKV